MTLQQLLAILSHDAYNRGPQPDTPGLTDTVGSAMRFILPSLLILALTTVSGCTDKQKSEARQSFMSLNSIFGTMNPYNTYQGDFVI